MEGTVIGVPLNEQIIHLLYKQKIELPSNSEQLMPLISNHPENPDSSYLLFQ